ncbi:hypothetical protein EZV62_008987 [Acer yangbiense]|uniref:Retrotransposon Copia-like N-terminal domain-containing protein n=1 Tax=Acer yangbiense TaxID=1000413 RepID=A0A5C7IFG3_9ROSI|nr:hypothetical protein EZV62_008987 [Acer yangbiense]
MGSPVFIASYSEELKKREERLNQARISTRNVDHCLWMKKFINTGSIIKVAAEMQELQLENRLELTVKLDHSNFLLWRQQVLAAIKDQIILCWLFSSISQDLLPQLVGCSTACEAWHAVERLFTSQSRANVTHLKLQLQTLKKSGSIITEYLIKKKIPITSMPEITALLLTHEARIEQHSQIVMLSVNLASNNQGFNQNKRGNTGIQSGSGRGNFEGNFGQNQDFCLFLLDILSHYTTIMQSNVEAWTVEIRGIVVELSAAIPPLDLKTMFLEVPLCLCLCDSIIL